MEPVADGNSLSFNLDVIESAFCCDRRELIEVTSLGAGKIVHCAVPLDWANPCEVQVQHYQHMLRLGRLELAIHGITSPEGVTLRELRFAEGTCVVAVNETSYPRRVLVAGEEVVLDAALTTLLWINKEGRIVERCVPRPR